MDSLALDGVLLPEIGAAFVDGQLPHLVEAKYPSALESYINLGEFYDTDQIRIQRDRIIRQYDRIHLGMNAARRYIQSASQLSDNIFDAVLSGVELERIEKRAKGIIKREIPKRKNEKCKGKLKRRFLSAITPQGIQCLYETVSAQCGRVYELDDSYGLSHFLLAPVKEAALEAGFDVTACFCPLKPDTKLDHLLIPELKLGFVTKNNSLCYEGTPYRRIRLDSYVQNDAAKQYSEKLRADKREMEILLRDAVAELKAASLKKEALEQLYQPYMDVDALLRCADEYAAALKLIKKEPESL